MRVYLDSDVVISSLISDRGAAFHLLHQNIPDVELFLSNLSEQEIELVITELKLDQTAFKSLIKFVSKVEVASVEVGNCLELVNDRCDAHIVAGANKAEAEFLLSYNLKDYKIEAIKRKFNLIIMTPGKFLQYLRSKE